jgi:diacylglycerol kinase (ATP)
MISSLLKSFEHAFDGVWHVLRTQRNARVHFTVAGVVILAGVWLGLDRAEWAILALTIGLVLFAEWFNTTVETMVDLVTEDYHPLAGIAKDVAAGAVLLTALVSVIVGVLILGIPILQRLLVLLP